MREAVDTPHDVDATRVPQDSGNKEGVCKGLSPKVHWNYCGEHEAEDWHHFHVMSGMKNSVK